MALLADTYAYIRGSAQWQSFAWRVQAIGTLGLLVAVASGLHAETTVVVPEAAISKFESHEQMAFLATSIFVLLSYWRLTKRGNILTSPIQWFLLLNLAGLVFLWVGAWYGGELVFGFGVGVRSP